MWYEPPEYEAARGSSAGVSVQEPAGAYVIKGELSSTVILKEAIKATEIPLKWEKRTKRRRGKKTKGKVQTGKKEQPEETLESTSSGDMSTSHDISSS
jgi:hypothetical protein